MVLTKANLWTNLQRCGLHFSGAQQVRPFVIIIISSRNWPMCLLLNPRITLSNYMSLQFFLYSNKTVRLFKWDTVFVLAPNCKNLGRESRCLSQMYPAGSVEVWLHGRTHTVQQGQIWMVPVKKVNPKSLTGPRKSDQDGLDSQSARGRRLSACDQSTNPPNCVATPPPPPPPH